MTSDFNADIQIGDFVPFSTYQAARSVARTVEEHFAHHHNLADISPGPDLAPRPDARAVELLIDTTFWASLRREEGHSPKISIAFLAPEHAGDPLVFQHKLAFNANVLTKLAPAVERAGIHLGVWYDANELYIWGTTRAIPALCFVVEVVEPGMLVIKHRRRGGYGKFVNVAVLKGDQVKIIDDIASKQPDCPSLVNSMIGFGAPSLWNDKLNIQVMLSASMRAHGRGGILLVVPAGSEQWRESIVHPISYGVDPSFTELAQLSRAKIDKSGFNEWQSKLTLAINSLAGLTAVDGATIINEQYELMAFGAKIARAQGKPPVEEILVTEPIVGNKGIVVPPVQNGGTRHLSAAQFVYDQRDAIALVASQDGRFTIFSWSKCDQIVQAHRVDALLL
ncbi:hypothetical protein DYBT9275_05624 [Dyadobacter sp. CECT 9275]|uniref:Probable sensor domain-containing protein n=2 Tax=Dyadobacter helix TaxID=2822344 RepID=A0A916JIP6_9BACT|nr:hypothetical protein DYBT9275_05624 [Dyadobacter sp. CECT 9275]